MNMGALRNNKEGFSILEAVIAMALFMLLATAVVGIFVIGSQGSKQGVEYVVAAGYLQEATEAVRSIRNRDYAEITAGTYGLDTSSGYYEFDGTSDVLDEYTRTITIEDVERDGSNNIVASGGADDPNTKRVTVNITWDTLTGKNQNVDHVFYIHNFVSEVTWVQDLTSEFDSGNFHSSDSASSDDGEVVLRGMQADWSGLSVAYDVDLEGNGDRVALYYDETQDLLFSLSENTTDNEFQAIQVHGSSTATPTELRGFDVGGANGTDFVISGDYAYIATEDNSAEIMVVDIFTMTQVNTIDLAGNGDATGVDITGSTLVIVRDNSGDEEMYFYDVSTPEGTLTELGSTELSENMTDVVVSSSYAFATSTDNTDELFVVRISDYTEVNTVNLTGDENANALTLVGSNLYIVKNDDGSEEDVYLLDVSSPEGSITTTSSLDTGTDNNDIVIDADEDFAFVATDDNSEEVLVIDLSSFTATQTGNTNSNSNANAIAQFGGQLFVGTDDDSRELALFKTNEGGWDFPALIGSANKSGNHDAYSIDVDGTFAYLGTDANGSDDELFIYDISTPSSPTLLGSFDVGADVYDLDADGDYVYLATADNSRELDIIDVSTKSSPVRVGSYNMSGNNNAFAVEYLSGSVYMGRDSSGNDEFWIIDVSTPASPTLTGSMNHGGDINDVVVDGTEVYAATDANSAELLVIDISTPGTPVSLGTLDLTGDDNGESVDVSGSTVVVGRDEMGSGDELVVIDVTTPASPSVLGSGDVSDDAWTVQIDGDYVYVASDENDEEFQRWDISTPASPTLVSDYDLDADGRDLFWTGTHAYLATEHNSLELQIIGPASSPSDYALEGTFTSEVYDAGSAVTWDTIAWTGGGSTSTTFKMEVGSTTVDDSFSTVALANTYDDPVVVTLLLESANTEPVTVRLDNVGASSFDLALQSPSGASLSTDTVYYMVVEEGDWTMPDGTLIEAGTIDDGTVAYKNNWSGTTVSFASSFSAAPVVFHNVMTYNDSDWIDSVIFSPGSRTSPPTTSGFDVSLNGAEAVTSHSTETIGWIAIEQGTGSIDGVDFEVDQTTDSVLGHDNGCNTFSFSSAFAAAPLVLIDGQEQDGNDGSWGVGCSLSASQVGMHAEEDQETDSERAHTTEVFGWAAFESAFDYAASATTSSYFRVRSASSSAGLDSARWVGSDGTPSTTYSASGASITTDSEASGTRYFQYKIYLFGDGSNTPSVEDVTITYH